MGDKEIYKCCKNVVGEIFLGQEVVTRRKTPPHYKLPNRTETGVLLIECVGHKNI